MSDDYLDEQVTSPRHARLFPARPYDPDVERLLDQIHHEAHGRQKTEQYDEQICS